MPTTPITITIDDFSEQELVVISEALKEFIDHREESGEACLECNSVGEDDEGESLHDHDCPVAVAIQAREKLGVEEE